MHGAAGPLRQVITNAYESLVMIKTDSYALGAPVLDQNHPIAGLEAYFLVESLSILVIIFNTSVFPAGITFKDWRRYTM
jgi:hypothetical protein